MSVWTNSLPSEMELALARIEELEAKAEALQAAVLELLGECGNPWPSGHPLSDVVAEALANHEPNNPRFGEDSDHE